MEINEIETKETIQKIGKTKSWFFEKVNRIDKPLITLTKRREKTHITKIRDERGNIMTDIMTDTQTRQRHSKERKF